MSSNWGLAGRHPNLTIALLRRCRYGTPNQQARCAATVLRFEGVSCGPPRARPCALPRPVELVDHCSAAHWPRDAATPAATTAQRLDVRA